MLSIAWQGRLLGFSCAASLIYIAIASFGWGAGPCAARRHGPARRRSVNRGSGQAPLTSPLPAVSIGIRTSTLVPSPGRESTRTCCSSRRWRCDRSRTSGSATAPWRRAALHTRSSGTSRHASPSPCSNHPVQRPQLKLLIEPFVSSGAPVRRVCRAARAGRSR